MRVEIKDIAKIKSAIIDIEGISVIAGCNGSGKSTIFKAIYSMCQSYGNLVEKVSTSRRESMSNVIDKWESVRMDDEDIPFFIEGVGEKFIRQMKDFDISWENLHRENIDLILSSCLIEASKVEKDELYSELLKVIQTPFEEHAKFIIERQFMYSFKGQLTTLGHAKKAKVSISLGKQEAKVAFLNNKIVDYSINQITMEEPVYIETNSYLDTLAYNRRRYPYRQSRTISRAMFADVNESNITLEKYKKNAEAKKICEQIMDNVTNGELVYSSSGEMKYRERDIKEEIYSENIASGLKNILLIQKMLSSGFIEESTLLLIDEPEVNLHPEWQVKFAEILVLIYKQLKTKIILNTHSPYFMRAIECKLAEYEIADKGKYYYMRTDNNKEYYAQDVTGKTEVVYETMYRPLENL